jgi:cell wall-associated NlpC family hydrolase
MDRRAPLSCTRRSHIRGFTPGRRRAAARIPRALIGAAALSALAVPAADARPVIDSRTAATDAPLERAALVRYATQLAGTPYRWGGSTPAGFDCSGLVRYVYAKFGVPMEHFTGAQYAAYPKVGRDDLRPGDLVFFAGRGHVGIYIGRGRFIHATRGGDHVRVSKLSEDWYRTGYAGAVRPPYPAGAPSTVGPVTSNPGGMRSMSSRELDA